MVVSATGKSLAALMIGRELRSRLDLLKEIPAKCSNRVFEDQTFRFRQGNIVMVRDYRDGRKPIWSPGRISRLIGATTCLVDVAGFTWKRHFNQLKRCTQEADVFPGFENQLDDAALLLTSDGGETEEDNAESSFHSATNQDSDNEQDKDTES